MSIFSSLFSKKPSTSPPSIRDTLFGDLPLEQWPVENATQSPWVEFVLARQYLAAGQQAQAIVVWQRVLDQPDLEARHYAQAWHFLRQHGVQPPTDIAQQLLGVIVEVGMPEGLDLLAAYPDYSARYYNYSGAGVVWEHPDESLDEFINRLLAAAENVVKQIGPWEEARPAAPPTGAVRLNFLTPSGLHFGQGPVDVFSKDPLAGPVFYSAAQLMNALIEKSSAEK